MAVVNRTCKKSSIAVSPAYFRGPLKPLFRAFCFPCVGLRELHTVLVSQLDYQYGLQPHSPDQRHVPTQQGRMSHEICWEIGAFGQIFTLLRDITCHIVQKYRKLLNTQSLKSLSNIALRRNIETYCLRCSVAFLLK
jgi:hypothetical protein